MAAETHAPPWLIRWRRWLWALTAAGAIAAAGFAGFALGLLNRAPAAAGLPVIRAAPRYALTNQLGRPVSSASFSGKVQIVNFLDPYCTDVCPLIAAHLVNFENLAARPAGIADKVEMVAFNLDPENAGPAQMREFLKEYGWNPKDLRWQYLTGTPAVIRHVVRDGFGVAYQRTPISSETGGGDLRVVEPEVVNKLAEEAHRGYDIAHSDIIEIVDRRGRVRKIFADADTVGSFDLLKVVQALLGGES
jgi:protein SCO1/2